MNSKETIALSALTIGVGAAALLGVSEVSEAGDNPEYCALEWNNCYLGYWPELTGIINILGGPVYQGYEQALSEYILYAQEGYPGGAYVYGSCVMDDIWPAAPVEELFCGCGGEAVQYQLNVQLWNYGASGFSHNVTPIVTPLFHYHNSQCWYP